MTAVFANVIERERSDQHGGDLSEGWVSAALPEVFELNPSKVTADALAEQSPVSFVPMAAVKAERGVIVSDDTRAFAQVRKGYTGFREGDVIMAKITPCFENGKAAVARRLVNGLGFGSTEFHVFRPTGAVLPEYLFHYIRQELFRKVVAEHMTGTVGQKRVPIDYLKLLRLPVPPLAEQRRILTKVETLLAQVNAARDRLARVPAIFKRFRQAVLAAACSGRLTEDWRIKNPHLEPADTALERCRASARRERRRPRRTLGLADIDPPGDLPETWTVRRVRELVEIGAILDFQDGNHGDLYPRSSDFGSYGIKFLTAKQVFDGRVFHHDAPLLSPEKASSLRIGFTRPQDVLLTHNATVGRVAILPEEAGECIVGTSVTYYRLLKEVFDSTYCMLMMQSRLWQDQLELVMEQTTRNQVSVKKQAEFWMVLPPLAEQRETARRVLALFSLADSIEKRMAAATGRARDLTQAVLAKAFRGKLVPTEAELAREEGRDYEPASVLLERVRAEREASAVTKKPNQRVLGQIQSRIAARAARQPGRNRKKSVT